jgi:anionic cell wall polymer biosynthesis LytR-Cps2A-Psr (LCP) family protein
VVKPGHRKLDGVQAVAYCRIRHEAGDDFGRDSRQRAVLTALMEKVRDTGVSGMTKYIDAVFPKVSTSLSMSQIMNLATHVSDYKLADTAAFPFYEKGTKLASKGYVMIPCTLEDNVKEAYKYLYNKEDYEPSE